jgi:hypothetical protein
MLRHNCRDIRQHKYGIIKEKDKFSLNILKGLEEISLCLQIKRGIKQAYVYKTKETSKLHNV